MSIGILTFHSQLNYGGVLPALALRKVVETLSGKATEVITLWHDPRNTALLGKTDNPNLPWFARWRNRRRAKKRPYGQKEWQLRREKTESLLIAAMGLSKETYRRPTDLASLKPYETVVVGSDQVWNPFFSLTGGPERNPYLGVTLPSAQDRVAYAASFGVADVPKEMYAGYRAALSHFRVITVRESSGSTLCARLCDMPPPPVVLDPTLLLEREAWKTLCAGRTIPERPYVLAYWLDGFDAVRRDWLVALSERLGLPIVLLLSGPVATDPEVPGHVTARFDADPLDFVTLVAHSEGVVTDSFHGMIFATLFERKGAFFLPQDPNDGTGPKRFRDFLSRYDIDGVCHDLGRLNSGAFPPEALAFVPLIPNTTKLMEDRQASLRALREMLP